MITTCWIGPPDFGAGDGVGEGVGDGVGVGEGGFRFFAVGLRFAALVGLRFAVVVCLRFDASFLIPRPV
jgi:hypothetical protein